MSSEPILFSKLQIRDKRIMLCVLLLYANPRLRLRQLANIVEDLSASRLRHLFKDDQPNTGNYLAWNDTDVPQHWQFNYSDGGSPPVNYVGHVCLQVP